MDISQTTRSIIGILGTLRNMGYTKEYLRDSSCLYCVESSQWISPESFHVVESYLYEALESPDASRSLFAISCDDGKKGILTEGYGVFADNMSLELAKKLFVLENKDGIPYLIPKPSIYENENVRITHRRFE